MESRFQVELLKRQYLQLLEPSQLSLPPPDVLKRPQVQAEIYDSMFREGCLVYEPADRYKLRVLKRLIHTIEGAVSDPDEDEISDDLISSLALLMSQQQDSELVAVQKKSYVTYSMPLSSPNAPTITTLEGRTLLAASGVTGFRTWEAALHLASFLCSPQGRNLIEGKNTLELGAGTGLLAMLCIKHLGSKYVLATDGSDEVIDDLTSNLYLNELDDDPQIDVAVLKWGHALIDGILDNHSGEAVNYDLILGADVTYDERIIIPLVSTLHELFGRYSEAKALISAPVRNEQTMDKFMQACRSRRFKLEVLSSDRIPRDRQLGFFYEVHADVNIFLVSPHQPES